MMKSSLSNSPKTLLFKIIISALFISTIIFYLHSITTSKYYQSDFIAFFSAAQILTNDQSNLYQYSTQHQYQHNLAASHVSLENNFDLPFLNPPFFLIPYLPLTNLHPQIAYNIIKTITTLLMIANLGLLIKLFKNKPSLSYWGILIALSFAPVYMTIQLAQSSILTLFIFIGIYYALTHKKFILTGILASLLLYKPQISIILIIYLITLKISKITITILSTSLILFIISLLMTDNGLIVLIQNLPTFYNQSINMVTLNWFSFFHQMQNLVPYLPTNIVATLVSLLLTIYTFSIIKNISPQSPYFPLAYICIIITTLLNSIHIHYHETTILIFALFFLLQKSLDIKTLLIICTGWVIYLLTAFSPIYPQSLPFLPTLYLFTIYIITIRRLNRNFHF